MEKDLLRSSWAISHDMTELKTNILDTIFFSIIRINDIDINPDNGGKTRL
jgi:hypothetical protein